MNYGSTLDFRGRTALVVGGSSGIGNAIAAALRDQGAFVHVWGTRASADDYGAPSDLAGMTYTQMDVGSQEAVAQYDPPFDKLDILVVSHGIVMRDQAEFEAATFAHVVQTNLLGAMAAIYRLKPQLTAAQGSLTVVTSTAAFQATGGHPGYDASKAGLVAMVRALAQSWASLGIRVNGIAPGLVRTKMTEAAVFADEGTAKSVARRIPMGRAGEPQDIAGVALFLASPLASYVCGQTLVIDGGLTI